MQVKCLKLKLQYYIQYKFNHNGLLLPTKTKDAKHGPPPKADFY